MLDENSLGPLGPNIISVEPVSATVYSVQGHNFATGFHVMVRDGVGQAIDGVTTSDVSATAFRLTLPYQTPGPCALVVANPDGRTSTVQFATPGTSASNEALRAE